MLKLSNMFHAISFAMHDMMYGACHHGVLDEELDVEDLLG